MITSSAPPWWNHQAYVARRLQRAVARAVDELALGAGARVVDVGCGDRPYQPLFTARGCQYVGCDLDGDADVVITPGRPLPLDDASADAVVSFQVLEHVWDLGWYLGECRRLLKPGARLLLSTHGTWLYHPHPTDFRRWTGDGLTRELGAHGFAVDRIEGLVGPLAWTTQFRLLGLRELVRRVPVVGGALLAPVAALMNARMLVEDAVTPPAVRAANACVYLTLSRPTA